MPTGHWNSQAPQVVHWKAASWELYLPSSSSSAVGAVFVEVAADAEDDFFGIEEFAGVVGGAVFGAAAALDAGVGLQADELGQVFAGDEAEIFIAFERWNLAEAAAREEDGDGLRIRCRCLVCGTSGKKTAGPGYAPTRGALR
jgi:hypothetical protein